MTVTVNLCCVVSLWGARKAKLLSGGVLCLEPPVPVIGLKGE